MTEQPLPTKVTKREIVIERDKCTIFDFARQIASVTVNVAITVKRSISPHPTKEQPIIRSSRI